MSNLLDFLQTREDAFKSPNRLASLYSDFHQRRQTNPEGYTANSGAWLSALATLSRDGQLPLSNSTSGQSHLAFTSGESLLRALSSPRLGRPQALGAVISDAIQSGALIPLDRFNSADKSIYNRSWVPGPSQVVSWGLRALGFTGGGNDKLIAGDLVVLSALESVAATIASQISAQDEAHGMSSLADQIYPRTLFEAHFRTAISPSQPLSSADFDILLRYLSRDKPILSYTSSSVKLAPAGQTPTPITPQDESIANLRALIAGLTTQVSALQTRVSALDSEARAAVAAHQNTKAKTALRQKRAAEGTLEQRTQTLATLERTWDSIEAAADNVAIVAAMRESGAVLKRLNAQVGGAEGADEVMERLRSEMDVTEDVTQAVTDGGRVVDVDEGEVEEELEGLERAEREKVEAVERAEREKEALQQEEETRKRLEALEVPAAEPQAHKEEEERFEEASETAA